MNLGSTIKTLRKQKGIKQNLFADKCDITQTYLSQIENNAKRPNLSTLQIISDKLGVPMPILFFLSLDGEDIKPEKRKSYTLLAPSIKSMVNEFFTNTYSKQ